MQQNLDYSNKKVNKRSLFYFLNEVCLLPRNGETEETFFARIEREFPGGIKRIESLLDERDTNLFPSILTSLHINVRFLPWVISSDRLRPWHLGVFESDGVRFRIQIHPRAKKRNRLIEVLSHEAIHFLRKDLEGPYEELLCYLISKKRLYKHMGFFLVSPEFKLSLLLSILVAFLPIWIDFSESAHRLVLWASPFLFALSFALCRFRLKAPFTLLKRFLSEKIPSAMPLLLRLDQREIDALFREKSPLTTMQSWAEDSFRWKFLTSLYLQQD